MVFCGFTRQRQWERDTVAVANPLLASARSQTPLAAERDGRRAVHPGEPLLGVPGQREAQAVLQLAEERTAAGARGTTTGLCLSGGNNKNIK